MNTFLYAWRMLCKQPGFTAVAVLTLALGLSANTSIFSVISTMFFQPLKVKDPEQLVLILQKSDVWKMPHGHSWQDYQDYRERLSVCSGVLALMLNPTNLSVAGQDPERAWIEVVSANYFSVLGVEPRLGRFFRPGEDAGVGGAPVVVISHTFWQQRFAGDPGVVGKPLNVNGRPFTIVGVAPEPFTSAQWSMAPNAFVPASMFGTVRTGGEDLLRERGAPMFKLMARLKPGITLGQARAAVDVVARQLAKDFPQAHKGTSVWVAPERMCRPEPTFSEFMPLLASVFMLMVGLVLLIACANVANLMFSRALARRKEMGIRTALGASRGRLVAQLLAESIVLALAAGAVGFILAWWSADLLAGFQPGGDMPVRAEGHWDWRVPVFTFVVSLLAGLATGLAPALRATRVDLNSVLKEGAGAAPGSRRHLFRSALVVTQVAISLVVLVCGGLFVRSLQQVARMDLGFRVEGVLMASLDLGLQGYDDARGRRFLKELVERARALPGVTSAGLAMSPAFDYVFQVDKVAVEEKAADPDSFMTAHLNRIDEQYLAATGTSLLRGRGFTPSDDETAPKVAIVNALLAERLWPGIDPMGKRFCWGPKRDLLQVVGIARTAKYVMLGEAPRPYFYVPLAQYYSTPTTLFLHTSGDPGSLVPAVRQVLRGLDAHLPVYNVRTMKDHLRDSAFAAMPLRLGAVLAGVQGVLGLLLAVMGIYGVVSYVVSQRTREIGIRIALGAREPDVVRLVVREGARLSMLGMLLGSVVALGLAQVIGHLLHGLTPSSLPVFCGVVGLLAGVSLLACWWPARRATRVDPVVALRCE